MKLLLLLIFISSCSSAPVFLSKKTKEFIPFHNVYIKEWNRTQKYKIGFYKFDQVVKGVCFKGEDDASTEILVNQFRWFKSNQEEQQVIITQLLNLCFYKNHRHSRNVYYL